MGAFLLAFYRREGGLHRLVLRLAVPPAIAPSDPPLFVRIRLDPAPPSDDTSPALGFEIERPHRIHLRCAALPETVWLGRLVAALAGSVPREEAR